MQKANEKVMPSLAVEDATMAPSPPSLPRNRVLVVQCRRQPTGAPARYDGRVEHLVSGEVARCHALEELLAFMIRVLADVEHQAEAP
jgi:hypothetical protein